MKKIKLMADYGCWPLWNATPGQVGNINPMDLPISDGLRHRLNRWSEIYDATLRQDDPLASGFTSREVEEEFKHEARSIAAALSLELGGEYEVLLHSRLSL